MIFELMHLVLQRDRAVMHSIPGLVQSFLRCMVVVAIALSGMLSAESHAATWYVRPAAPAGTYGSENGTSYANAFNGLTQAAGGSTAGIKWGPGGVQAGDTLYISGNHWLQISSASQSFPYGRIAIPVQGLSDQQRITIRCDAPESPGIVWGYGRNTSLPDVWSGPDANGVYSINRDLGQFIAQDVTLGPAGVVYLNEKSGTTWTGSNGAFSRSGGFTYVKTTDGSSPAGRLYTADIPYRFALLRNNYITFKNCVFNGFLMDVDRNLEGELVPDLPRSSNITFEGCVMRYSFQSMIRLFDGNNFWRFYNCTMEYAPDAITTYGTFGGVGASNMHIAGCTFRHMGVLMFPHQDAHAIGIRRGRDILIENNTIEDTGSAIEFWTSVGAPMRDMTVRHNFITNIPIKSRSEGSGIVISGDNGPTLGERTGFNIHGNIITNAQGAGISSNNLDPVIITNNVVYNCNVGLRLDSLQSRSVQATVKNNIIAYPWSTFVILVGTGNILDWDYNLYARYDAAAWNPWGSFEQWRSVNNVDAHSVVDEPGFLVSSPSQPLDFQLARGSIAIDAGTDVGRLTDFVGAPVPDRLVPDIGAFETPFERHAGVATWSVYP